MKIGITGTIGSGKSQVLSYIESKGYNVFDSDKYAHYLLTREDIVKIINDEFGCVEDGVVDRKCLGKIVFNDNIKLERLNKIIHTLVKEKIASLDSLIFVDVPLLFEANMEEYFDAIIVVSAPKDIIIERIMKRDNLSKKEANNRISLQKSDEYKKNRANYVIINETTINNLHIQVDEILEGLNV